MRAESQVLRRLVYWSGPASQVPRLVTHSVAAGSVPATTPAGGCAAV